MRRELFVAAFEQRLSSRLRIVLAVGVNFVAAFGLGDGFPFGYFAPVLTAYIVSAGVLGKEFSSGTPQLTFARPVQRVDYVLARWLACVAAMLAFNVVAVVIGAVALHAAHSQGVNFVHLAVAELGGAGACAVVLGFSALSNGFADIVLVAATGVLSFLLQSGAEMTHDPDRGFALSIIGDLLSRWNFPAVNESGLHYDSVTVASLALFAAAVATWLLVAVLAVRRREITYATD